MLFRSGWVGGVWAPTDIFPEPGQWVQLSGVRALEKPVLGGFHQHFSECTDPEMLPKRQTPGPHLALQNLASLESAAQGSAL